jgi:hypothetical protein
MFSVEVGAGAIVAISMAPATPERVEDLAARWERETEGECGERMRDRVREDGVGIYG